MVAVGSTEANGTCGAETPHSVDVSTNARDSERNECCGAAEQQLASPVI